MAADAERTAANATDPGLLAALQPLMVIGLPGWVAAAGLGMIERRRYKRKHKKK